MTYKIYKIVPCDETADENDVYYGSTEKHYLCSRMNGHKSDYVNWLDKKRLKNCASFSLFDKYGFDNCKIVLLEEFEFDAITKYQLRHREADYIEQNPCVNILNPRPWTEEQKKACRKKYNKEHPVTDPDKLLKIKQYSADWYQKNKKSLV